MERLTQPCKNTEGGKYIDHVAGDFVGIYPDCTLGKVVDRLAAYEDTGLTPEDIKFLVRTLPNAEFLLAKAQGRLLILPCSVGSIVYGADTSPVMPLHVMAPALYLESEEGGDFETLDNFGKTVFLTREEAERALEKEKRFWKERDHG